MDYSDEKIPVYPAADLNDIFYDEREPIARFVRVEDLTPEIRHLFENSTLGGLYTDGVKTVALDIWNGIHENIFKEE